MNSDKAFGKQAYSWSRFLTHLLGGLLLLLFLLSALGCGRLSRRLLLGCFRFRFRFRLFLLATSGNEKTNHILAGNKAVVINLEFSEDIINLSL